MKQEEALTIAAVFAALYLVIQFLPSPGSAVDAPDAGDAGGGSILDSLAGVLGMGGDMVLSQQGEDFIKRHESVGGRADLVGYADSKGIATDGWGNTHGAVIGVGITMERAESDFLKNTREAVAAINNTVRVPLTQGQFDALVSFRFNIGAGRKGWDGSHLLLNLNNYDYASVPSEMMRWIYSGGRPVLTSRREAEVAVWEASTPAPPLQMADAGTGGDGSNG